MDLRICLRRALFPVSFVFIGAACTFLGPYLPVLTQTWHLRDGQAGVLLACLFVGSCAGTVLLGSRLDRSIRRGSVAAAAGLALFGSAVTRDHGFVVGAGCILLAGFGLGQMMSSINLVVGNAENSRRSQLLARLSAAWCIGALMSPLVTSIQLHWSAIGGRIQYLAFALLLPLVYRAQGPIQQPEGEPHDAASRKSMYIVALCCLAFLLYGGVEASLSGWIALYASRYSMRATVLAQWVPSAFWLGLILSRISVRSGISRATEGRMLRIALIGAGACTAWIIAAPAPIALIVAAVIAGAFVGPVFPLMLSICLDWKLSTRRMGVVLAACAIGGAVLPFMMGRAAETWSLRWAMLLPIAAIAGLIATPWLPPAGVRRDAMLEEVSASSANAVL